MAALSPTWRGRNWDLTIVRWFLYFILVVAITQWGLGIALYIGVFRTPVDQPTWTPPGRSQVFIYACVLPIITTFVTAAEVTLYHLNRLYPVVSIVWSLFSGIGWAAMWAIWFGGEYGYDTGGELLFTPLETVGDNGDSSGFSPTGSGRSLFYIRLIFGFFPIVLYFIYTGIASAAVHKNNMEVRNSKVEAAYEAGIRSVHDA